MFQSIKINRPKLSKFDLSHEHKLSCNMGSLIPIMTQEVVPGDRFRVNSEIMMRMAPMLAPVMHRVNVWVHYFFVPNRLIWNEWEDFITGGIDGNQAPVHPYYEVAALNGAGYFDVGSLADYFGFPLIDTGTTVTVDQSISALPFRAYNSIFKEYYIDRNLAVQADYEFSVASGNANADVNPLRLRRRAWEKDYFTSALPWAQRGTPISIPGTANYADVATVHEADGTLVDTQSTIGQFANGNLAVNYQVSSQGGSIHNLEDIGIDINDLRTSNSLQRWLELAARGGSRYIEQVKAFFGVSSSDARLQRPEYLGGGRQNVVISEVLQTSDTAEGTTPQGNMAGHGVSVGSSNRFSRRFEEHGFVMGIMSVLPRTAYQQGIDRMFARNDRFDYYWPQFAHLGEQEIRNAEVYYDGTTEAADTWGYQSRYAEYKYKTSQISGDFRTNLNFWHMGRIFTAPPPLNNAFVVANPTHRIFANTTETDHKLWVQVYNKVDALRPMPYYGTPRL